MLFLPRSIFIKNFLNGSFYKSKKHSFLENLLPVADNWSVLSIFSLFRKWRKIHTFFYVLMSGIIFALLTVSPPRCRRCRACVFRWSLRLCGIATHERYSIRWDSRPSGTRGFTPCVDSRGSLPGRVCSSDVPVHVNQCEHCNSNSKRCNSGKGPYFFKKG